MMKLLEHTDTLIFATAEDHVDENFYYSSGISKTKCVSAVLIANKNGRVILTNKLENGLFSGKKIIIDSKERFESTLRKYCGKKIGMNLDYMSANTLARYKKILAGRHIIDISKQMGEMRAIKTKPEISRIKEACKITEDVFSDIEKLLRKARTEKELALEMRYAAIKNGAEDVAYPTIVAAGRNAALPHHASGSTKISGMLLIDFGVIYDGYCSDMTRTFFVGKKDARTKTIYDVVYRAQQAAIKKMKAGTAAKEIHNTAENIIKKELNQKLIHAFGHGLGIQVHDYPGAISSKSEFKLKNNMVLTAEPGYYKSTWGGVRIEDDIVVGKGALTAAPKELLVV